MAQPFATLVAVAAVGQVRIDVHLATVLGTLVAIPPASLAALDAAAAQPAGRLRHMRHIQAACRAGSAVKCIPLHVHLAAVIETLVAVLPPVVAAPRLAPTRIAGELGRVRHRGTAMVATAAMVDVALQTGLAPV